MHDLAIMACRYFGAGLVIFALTVGIVGLIEPFAILAPNSWRTRRERRNAIRTVYYLGGLVVLAIIIGVCLVLVSFQ